MNNELPAKEQEIFNKLLNVYLEPTERILAKDKVITPMAVTMNATEQIDFVAMSVDSEENASTGTEGHMRAYRQLLRIKPDTIACLLAYDVSIKNDPLYNDGISIEIETKSGHRTRLLLPYKFTGLTKNKLKIGDIRRSSPAADKIYI